MKRLTCVGFGLSGNGKRRRMRLAAALLGLGTSVAWFGNPASAQTTWAFPTTGTWSDATKWSTGVVPDNAAENVLVSQSGTYTVTLDDNRSINDLTLNAGAATFRHTSGILSLNGALQVLAGRYELAGGTLSGGTLTGNDLAYVYGALDAVSVTGGITLSEPSGYVTFAGGTTVAGDIAVENTSTIYVDQTFSLNSQTMTLGDAGGTTSGVVYLLTGSMVTIDSGSTVRANAAGFYLQGGELINEGLIEATLSTNSGLYDFGGGTFTNRGTVTASNGAILDVGSGNTTNVGGTMSSTLGSSLTMSGAWSNSGGVLSTDGTSSLSLGGTFDTANLGTINRATGGNVYITGAQNNVGSTFSPGAGWTLAGGTISGGTLTGNDLAYASGVLDAVSVTGGITLSEPSGYVTLSGGTTVAGDIAVENNSTIYVDQAFSLSSQTMTLGDAGGTTSGVVYLLTGSMVTIDSGSTVRANAAGFYLQGGELINEGLIEATLSTNSGLYDFGGGTFTNRGTVTASNGAILDVGSGNTTNVGGTMSSTLGSSLTMSGAWSNSGGVLSTDGTSSLSLGGTFDTANLGTINVASGGKVYISGTQTNVGSTFSPGPGWTLAGGTISGGTLNGNSLAYSYGALDAVSVTGGMTLSEPSGYVTVMGGTTIAGDIGIDNSSTLYIDQDHTFSNQKVTLGDVSGTTAGTVYFYQSVSTGNEATFASDSQLVGNGTVFSSTVPVHLDGTISPGFSVGILYFNGDGEFDLGSTAMLDIELGGTNPGEFDTLTFDRLTLGGGLNVSLVNGFTLADGMVFDFLFVSDPISGTGMFNGLNNLDTVGTFGGFDLKVAYGVGDGNNDVRLFSVVTAVPEPSAVAALAMGGLVVIGYRKRRQKLVLA
ncbi:hypothetical protein Poly51_44440 [Rubripirellula tenax]|uniref:Autotransporter-associated beta strand repeat protein n=1 Tax=Rubripirellula tenax TaxID=2528015 RepID=A0A5C6EJ72_9BACT|nr:PEP-CTERM sorting domain-containing protein [Rubripirellula tenax]TWU48544.1 hypothetical protein Poly51_44440 [Rubripirellula tenax]